MTLAMYKEPEFTLPHPPIPLSVFLVVEEAICAAWKVLQLHPPPGFTLAVAIETEINAYLHEVLKDRIWNRDVVCSATIILSLERQLEFPFRNQRCGGPFCGA